MIQQFFYNQSITIMLYLQIFKLIIRFPRIQNFKSELKFQKLCKIFQLKNSNLNRLNFQFLT